MIATALFITFVGMAVSWLFLFVIVEMTRCFTGEHVKVEKVKVKQPDGPPPHASNEDDLQIAVAIATAMARARG